MILRRVTTSSLRAVKILQASFFSRGEPSVCLRVNLVPLVEFKRPPDILLLQNLLPELQRQYFYNQFTRFNWAAVIKFIFMVTTFVQIVCYWTTKAMQILSWISILKKLLILIVTSIGKYTVSITHATWKLDLKRCLKTHLLLLLRKE